MRPRSGPDQSHPSTTGEGEHDAEHNPILEKTISRDGTPIGFWRTGQGPALVLVHGTTADASRWETVLPLFAPHATVYARRPARPRREWGRRELRARG